MNANETFVHLLVTQEHPLLKEALDVSIQNIDQHTRWWRVKLEHSKRLTLLVSPDALQHSAFLQIIRDAGAQAERMFLEAARAEQKATARAKKLQTIRAWHKGATDEDLLVRFYDALMEIGIGSVINSRDEMIDHALEATGHKQKRG